MAVNRSSLQIGLYLALVFVSGALVGAFGHRLYSANTVAATTQTNRHDPRAFRAKYAKDLDTRLKLEDGQKQRLEVILDETDAQFKAVRERMSPEMKQITNEQRDKIRQMLNDGQKAEYEKMLEEREQRRKNRSAAPGGGGC